VADKGIPWLAVPLPVSSSTCILVESIAVAVFEWAPAVPQAPNVAGSGHPGK